MCPISLCNFPPLALQVAFSLFPDATVFFAELLIYLDLPGQTNIEQIWIGSLFGWLVGRFFVVVVFTLLRMYITHCTNN